MSHFMRIREWQEEVLQGQGKPIADAVRQIGVAVEGSVMNS